MGLVVSSGKNNDELIDNLVEHDSIKDERVERIMRLVDRGKFMPETAVNENAYKDSAWKSDTGDPGFFHISAPCIYANVLESLDLQKGMAFLNIGSGTGYLSTLAGFFLEESGINHGIELYDNVVNFANERIEIFQTSSETCAFEWCSPSYFVGNAFQIVKHNKYDRIYCGALVPESHRAYFCSFLKINGILVMPYGHSLQRIIRKSEKIFATRDISAVTFSHLIPVNLEEDNSLSNRPVSLPQFEPNSLKFICRNRIRQLIRQKLLLIQPVDIYSICAEKAAKLKNTTYCKCPRSGSSTTRSVRVRPPTRFNPVVIIERGDQNYLNTRTTLPVAQDGDNQLNLPGRHAAQFRHLFALFARDRIRRHHAAVARRAADYVFTSSDSDSDDEENGQRRNGNNTGQQQQDGQRREYYNGPNDCSYNFIFESERDDDEEEEEEEESFNENMSEVNEDEAIDHALAWAEENLETDSLNSSNDLYVTANSETINEEKHSDNDNEDDSVEFIPSLNLNEDENNVNNGKGKEGEEKKKDNKNEKDKIKEENKDKNNKNGGNNNNKRSRTFTPNSSEMPQSSKIKRRLSNNNNQGGPSTSSAIESNGSLATAANSLINIAGELDSTIDSARQTINNIRATTERMGNDINKIKNKLNSGKNEANVKKSDEQSCSTSNENESNEEENTKLNQVKSEEKTKQFSIFYKNFIESIQSLPLNIQMRKFLAYENI